MRLPYRTALHLLLLFALLLLAPGCAFHSTAQSWNDRTAIDGKVIWYTATSKVALNLFVVLPFLGDIGTPGMVDELTAEIAARGGNGVRIVQGSSENYWYGFPPVTWIFTPVVSQVHAEWHPHPVSLAKHAARCSLEEREAYAEQQAAKQQAD